MLLDYDIGISREPLYIQNVGTIISPTIGEVYKLTVPVYNRYVAHLRMTPEDYFETYHPDLSISDDALLNMKKYDIVLTDDYVRQVVTDAFNFFFIEEFKFYSEYNAFVSVAESENGDLTATGVINQDNYAFITDTILQRLHIAPEENVVDDISKAKNAKGIEIYKKLAKGRRAFRKAKSNSSDLTLANIVASVSAWSGTINWINVWDLTVFQLLDLYERLRINDAYSIRSMQVAAHGDQENKFQLNAWSKNIYDKNETS